MNRFASCKLSHCWQKYLRRKVSRPLWRWLNLNPTCCHRRVSRVPRVLTGVPPEWRCSRTITFGSSQARRVGSRTDLKIDLNLQEVRISLRTAVAVLADGVVHQSTLKLVPTLATRGGNSCIPDPTWSGIKDLSSGLCCFLNSVSKCAMNNFENLGPRQLNDEAYAT